MNQRNIDYARNHSVAFVLPIERVRATDLDSVGGKGANLGELTAAGFPVPPGFCVTTVAFEGFMAAQTDVEGLYTRLDALKLDNVEQVRLGGQQVRDALRRAPIPSEVAQAVIQAWQTLGCEHAYAVRSSATVEDLPDASFAGQQDTYLNVRGETALLESVRNCWASLFTDRAILYRLQHGVDHRKVRIAVVVQRMIEPQVSGIMFTADPVTGNRSIISIDASFGLGEALVSGTVSADLYHVDKRERRLVKRQIADKGLLIRALPEGGVERVEVPGDMRTRPALTDAQVLELATLGAQIEAHYGTPQDIEWALYAGDYAIVQSRPITTLYPLPQPTPHDGALHIYFSFNHFQVMTDPLPDLVISLWRIMVPAGRPAGVLENPYLRPAGGRIYIDISSLLHHRLLGRVVPNVFAGASAQAGQAIAAVAKREAFRRRGKAVASRTLIHWEVPVLSKAIMRLVWGAPEGMSAWGLRLMDRYLAQAEARLAAAPTTAARLKVAVALLLEVIPCIFRDWFPYFIAGELANGLLQRIMHGVAALDDLVAVTRGLQGNVVTAMDLAVGDLADCARQSPALMRHLSQQNVEARTLLDTAATLPGGPAFLAAWQHFIEQYGLRAPAEIDLRRPRWQEDPSSLLQMVVSHMRQSETGAHRAQYLRLVAEGEAAAQQLVQAAWRGPWGWIRGPVVRRLIRVVRQLLPTREHHKFWLIRLLGLVKPVFLEAGEQLAAVQRIKRVDDVWFLTMPELLAALDGSEEMLHEMVAKRRAALAHFHELTPPSVITSEGEIPIVDPAVADAPPGALIGTPVSAGVVEGIAHVVRDPQTTALNRGEILVAPFTDPGWTPLFINAAGIVTEVGGVMTHGSVVAREYGIPAVVGVVEATKRIHTGQRIRVHGIAGYVEILDADEVMVDPVAARETFVS